MSWLWVEAHLSIAAAAILILLASSLLLQERRTPQSTLAWLLAMAVLPYAAVPLYLLLGARKLRRYPPPRFGPAEQAETEGAIFVRLGAAAPRGGNSVDLLELPGPGWAALAGLIDGATESIDAAFYIVDADPEGRAFVAALARRARDGVRVRLLIDRLGTLRPPRAELRALESAGGKVAWFSPFRRMHQRGRLNLRNHRKVLIADGEAVFSGGMNVSGDYLRIEDGGPDGFLDLGYVLRGPAVTDHAAVFASDWTAVSGEDSPPAPVCAPAGREVVQVVASGPDMRHDALHLGLVSAIHRADRRVWLATPYFLPTEQLAVALAVAARRGLDVRLLVPDRSNHRLADLARGAYLRGLEAEGCRVLRHPRMVHAKAGLIDDTGWIGTANFDVRSMLLNFETALMLHTAGARDGLERWFTRQAEESAPGLGKSTLPRRLVEGLFRLTSPLL